MYVCNRTDFVAAGYNEEGYHDNWFTIARLNNINYSSIIITSHQSFNLWIPSQSIFLLNFNHGLFGGASNHIIGITLADDNFNNYPRVTKYRIVEKSSIRYLEAYIKGVHLSATESSANKFRWSFSILGTSQSGLQNNSFLDVSNPPAPSDNLGSVQAEFDIIKLGLQTKFNQLTSSDKVYTYQFYHNTENKWSIFKLGIIQSSISMMNVYITGNTYSRNLPIELQINFYQYNSQSIVPYLACVGNNLSIPDGIFIVKLKYANEIAIILDNSKFSTARTYFSGICRVESTSGINIDLLGYTEVADDTALNNVIDTTYGTSGKVNFGVYTYQPVSNGKCYLENVNASFAGMEDNLITRALDNIDPSQLQNIQFLQVDYCFGVFVKSNGDNNKWTWTNMDSRFRERILERYQYENTGSATYRRICKFFV